MRPGYRDQERDRAVALQQNPVSLGEPSILEMPFSSKQIGVGVVWASIAASLVAMVVLDGLALGVALLLGFGAAAVPFLLGLGGIAPRRRSVAFGLYLLVCSAKSGADWSGLSFAAGARWVPTAALLLAVLWFVFETHRTARGGPTSPPA
jgi:hypothetical protein